MRRWTPLLGVVAVVAAAGVLTTRALKRGSAQPSPRPVDTSFPSRALGGRLAMAIYLPPDYSTSGLRYPVVYFLHGLPAGPVAYRGVGFLADTLDKVKRRAILVAPQGARDGDADPEYRLYPGAHEQRVWTAHARAWLQLALEHLGQAR